MTTHAITFNLPEDQDDLTLALHGQDFYMALWDLDQWLRSEIKYQNRDELEPVRTKLYLLLQERGVSLDMVS